MVMPKKGSKLIVVEGVKYRWRVRQKPTYCQGNGWANLTVSVERFTEPGAVLTIDMDQARLDAWLSLPRSAGVLPSEIAQGIREASGVGWHPATPGKPFRLQMRREVERSTALDAQAGEQGRLW